MLSLVAGPTPLFAASPGCDVDLDPQSYLGLWVDGWGLVCLQANTDAPFGAEFGAICFIKPHGATVRAGWLRTHYALGWDADQKCPVLGYDPIDPKMYRATFPALGQTDDQIYSRPGSAYTFGLMADRMLVCTNGKTVQAAAIGSTTLATEYTYDGTAGTGLGGLWYAGHENGKQLWWVYTCGAPGVLWLYDATNKTKVAGSESRLGAFRLGGYSVKHRLFYVVTGNLPSVDLSVYAPEPVATQLSTPTLSAPALRGSSRTLSTTVLGASNEPCPGRNVAFAVTAGSVSPAVVATDASGIARTTFLAPTSVGDVTATATLVE